MSSSAAEEIKVALARFLFQGESLRDLRAAIIPAIYHVEDADGPAIEDLADELALRFAEHDHGDWTEDDLREHLVAYLRDEWPALCDHLLQQGKAPAFEIISRTIIMKPLSMGVRSLATGLLFGASGTAATLKANPPSTPQSDLLPQTGSTARSRTLSPTGSA